MVMSKLIARKMFSKLRTNPCAR